MRKVSIFASLLLLGSPLEIPGGEMQKTVKQKP